MEINENIMNTKIANESELKGPFTSNICAFYANIPHISIDDVIKDLEEYYNNNGLTYVDEETGYIKSPPHIHYLIGLEANPREHMHFVTTFTDNEYAAYVKRVLKGKYGLSGTRSKKGNTGQFGKVREAIRDLDRMCAYTIKELNFYGNIDLEGPWVKHLLTIAHEKPENDKNIQQECMEFIKNDIHQYPLGDSITVDHLGNNKVVDHPNWSQPQEIACSVIKFLKTKNKDITAHTVRRYTLRYIAYHTNTDEGQLYFYLFPHGV